MHIKPKESRDDTTAFKLRYTDTSWNKHIQNCLFKLNNQLFKPKTKITWTNSKTLKDMLTSSSLSKEQVDMTHVYRKFKF